VPPPVVVDVVVPLVPGAHAAAMSPRLVKVASRSKRRRVGE